MQLLLPGFFSRTALSIIDYFLSSFFSKHLIKVQLMQPYNSTDMATAWNNSCFILSERLDFHVVVKLSIVVHAFPMHMLRYVDIDEIWLPRCMNSSINFSGLQFNEKMTSSWLKAMNSALSKFIERPMPLAACSRLYRIIPYLVLCLKSLNAPPWHQWDDPGLWWWWCWWWGFISQLQERGMLLFVFRLVGWVYGTSTIVGYLMPNSVFAYFKPYFFKRII